MLDYLQTSIKLAVIKNYSVNLLFSNVKNTKLLLLIDELSHLDSKSWLSWAADKQPLWGMQKRPFWSCFSGLWYKWSAQVCSQCQGLVCYQGAVLCQWPSIWTSMTALKRVFIVEISLINLLWIKSLWKVIC